jgi:hypothetical protein
MENQDAEYNKAVEAAAKECNGMLCSTKSQQIRIAEIIFNAGVDF